MVPTEDELSNLLVWYADPVGSGLQNCQRITSTSSFMSDILLDQDRNVPVCGCDVEAPDMIILGGMV